MKVNHYAAKTVKTSYAMMWEMLLTEFVIACICGVFAYMGFKAKVLLIFIPNLFLSICCVCLLLYSLISWLIEKSRATQDES